MVALDHLVGDVVRQICNYLQYDAITRLACTTKVFLGRLQAENIIQDVVIDDLAFSLPSIPIIGRYWRRLRLKREEPKFYYRAKDRKSPAGHGKSFDWLKSLPRSLEDIEFDFPDCSAVWLRKAGDLDIHWSFKACGLDYYPVWVDEYFPNLKRLHLHQTWIPFYCVVECPPSPLNIFQQRPVLAKRPISWSFAMKLAFIKRLPKSLTSLRLGSLDLLDGYVWRSLPPHLTEIITVYDIGDYHRLGDESCKASQSSEIPPSLLESLTSWSPGEVSYNKRPFLADYLGRLVNITRLNLLKVQCKEPVLRALPKSLTSLSIDLSRTENTRVSFIPHSVTDLELILSITEDNDNIEDKYDVIKLLPPHLTQLRLSVDTGSFYDAPISEPMKLLGAHLPHLMQLSYDTMKCGVVDDLSWTLLCPTLRTLQISCAVLQPSADYFGLPPGSPSNLTALTLGPQVPMIFGVAPHAKFFPAVGLTALELDSANTNVNVLTMLPSTLKEFTFAREVKPWRVEDVLELLAAKKLPCLDKLAGPLLLGPTLYDKLLEEDEESLDDYSIDRVGKRLERVHAPTNFMDLDIIWSNDVFAHPPFRTTIKSIDLKNLSVSSDNHPIWQLDNLTSLKLAELIDESFDTGQLARLESSNVRLTTLAVRSRFDGYWLHHLVFHAITSLACDLGVHADRFPLRDLPLLTSLTSLDMTLGEVSTSLFVSGQASLSELLPWSVTDLRTTYLPENSRADQKFWNQFKPPTTSSSSSSGSDSATTTPTRAKKTPNHLQRKLSTLHLRGRTSRLSAEHLALLAPHLTCLQVEQAVMVHDLPALFSKLERTCSVMDDEAIACALLGPTFQGLPPPPVDGALPSAFAFAEVSGGKRADLAKVLARSGAVEWMKALPTSLVALDRIPLWVPSFAPMLPVGLKHLDLSSFDLDRFCRDYLLGEMPASLESLRLRPGGSPPLEFFSGLPRHLKNLILEDVELVDESIASALPAGLQWLEVPCATLTGSIALPRNLTGLWVLRMDISEFLGLPGGLTHLSLSEEVPCDDRKLLQECKLPLRILALAVEDHSYLDPFHDMNLAVHMVDAHL